MKSKRHIKILSCLLATFMLTGVACNQKDSSSSEELVPEVKKISWNEGTHIFTAEDTDKYLVQNGQTSYQLVYSSEEKNSLELELARKEFIQFFQEATGIRMSMTLDTNLTHSPNNKYISLGPTTLLESAGIEVDSKQLGLEGARIVTKDQTIFITGGGNRGVLYAVYDFMNIMFDYEFYFVDTYTINTGVTEAKLKKFDVTDIPDFEWRCRINGFMDDGGAHTLYRYRMPDTYGTPAVAIYEDWIDRENLIIDTTSAKATEHNSLYYVPKRLYQGEHPNWYSISGEQLCYTARGDDEELELLAKECADKMKASLKVFTPDKYPLKYQIGLSMEDNTDTCACEGCMASKSKYGTDSAAVIRFMNMVNADLQSWMEEQVDEPWYRERVCVNFFAYNAFTAPPTHYDEVKGEYVANDESLICDKGVVPFFADISAKRQQSFYSSANQVSVDSLRGWGAIADELWLWTYQTNFKGYLWMEDTFSMYTPDIYQEMKAAGGILLYNQSQGPQEGAGTAFHNLKAYLTYKLSWDCNLDYQTLIEDYFENVYKEAAPYMKQLWVNERLYRAKINNEYNYWGVEAILTNAKFWDYGVLMSWMNLCEQGLAAVSKYQKTNPALYKTIKRNIDAELVCPAYFLLDYHSSRFSTSALQQLQKRLKEAVELTGMTATSPSGRTALTNYVKNF